jgi:Cof subfamily protein (haloacid dehalogenase superfamily)
MTRRRLRLVVADVDGTLVNPDRILTERTRTAVRTICDAGIAFTITSGRPPLGLKTFIHDLHLREPVIAFNGGLLVRPDLSTIREHLLTNTVAQLVVETLAAHRLDVWIYSSSAWYVTSRRGAHVDREERTVKFPPTVVPTFKGLLDGVVKIVGVSDDAQTMARCVAAVQRRHGHVVSAALSQPYYLDVTHPRANKGEAVTALSELLAVRTAEIVTVGDMPNDVQMFARSGMSIAMGNASADVKRRATFVTTSNAEEGFAMAMERFVLQASPA